MVGSPEKGKKMILIKTEDAFMVFSLLESRGPLDIKRFTEKFVDGNTLLTSDADKSLLSSIEFFMDCIPYSGDFCKRIFDIIKLLCSESASREWDSTKDYSKRNLKKYVLWNYKNGALSKVDPMREVFFIINSIKEDLKNQGETLSQ